MGGIRMSEKELTRVGLQYDKTKGYSEMIHCSNCNWFCSIYIPYENKVKDYLKDKKCVRCQCVGVLF
jgi:hypothetical protein